MLQEDLFHIPSKLAFADYPSNLIGNKLMGKMGESVGKTVVDTVGCAATKWALDNIAGKSGAAQKQD